MAIMCLPVLHIHPTRLCNLTCAHCYSASGPRLTASLPAASILAAAMTLHSEGYLQASLSGGEPMLYPDITPLTAGLRAIGYHVSVITNGWYPDRLWPLCQSGAVQSVSVSFDGLAPLHDRVRRRKGAFDKAIACLRLLAERGQRVGAVVAVTRAGLPDLPDLVESLIDAGAAQIQFHPVAGIGRALETGADCAELDAERMLRLLLLTRAFAALHPEVAFSTDAATGQDIAASDTGGPGSLISPLVIDDQGQVLPFAWGIDPALGLGNIASGFESPRVTPDLDRLLQATRREAGMTLASAFYPELVRASQRLASLPV